MEWLVYCKHKWASRHLCRLASTLKTGTEQELQPLEFQAFIYADRNTGRVTTTLGYPHKTRSRGLIWKLQISLASIFFLFLFKKTLAIRPQI